MAVTRADVARRAGVSPAVVSYVLNPGSRPVSAGARRRIEDAIRELNYRPNAVAQALRRSSTKSLGLMVPDLGNPVVAVLSREIEDIAYDHGYVLFVGTVGHDRDREERYVRNYVDRQVDALIAVGSHRLDVLKEMALRDVPIVVLDSVVPGDGISSVVPETRGAAAAAVRHLIDVHGHTRVGCIGGPAGTTGTAEDRVAGWRDAMHFAGLSTHGLLVRTGFTRSGGHVAGLEMLSTTDATAAFVISDVQAVGAIGAARERGLLIPEDFAFVGFDGSETAERAFPGLTAVDTSIAAVASLVMERLLAKLDKSDVSETHDVVPTRLVIRRSCGCAGPASSEFEEFDPLNP